MTATDPLPLTTDEITEYFIQSTPPEPNTFELALVLGGTVSAGAYTAGALDFLFEALDQWTELRDAGDDTAPTHRLQIKVIAGTSGGGVNAAIAARALAYRYVPVSRGAMPQGSILPPYGQLTGNPFYDVWCSILRLDEFLDNADLKSTAAVSILNGKPIDDAAAYIAGFTTQNEAHRSYMGEPLRNEPMRVILTLTNLQGVPYRTTFNGPDDQPVWGQAFVDHADHMRFAVGYWGQAVFTPRPDETVLNFEPAIRMPQGVDWGTFSMFARATAAFPLGFPARPLNRNMLDYRYRVAAFPADADGMIEVRGLTPDWDQLKLAGVLPDTYSFVAVDGGATDNEPVQLARTAMCGVTGRNPRGATTANRGVLLIDPFAGEADLGGTPVGLFAVASSTLGTLLQQTRYDTADMAMAADPDIYSRFMISADRNGISGGNALAGGGLGAFMGFACPAFMRHDYLLGRKNCQDLLKRVLVVDHANPVVAGKFSAAQLLANGYQQDGTTYVQLIPLLGTAAVDEQTDPWPVGALNPDTFKPLIEARWTALIDSETSDSWWKTLAGWLGGLVTEGSVAGFVSDKMRADLVAWKLLPPS